MPQFSAGTTTSLVVALMALAATRPESGAPRPTGPRPPRRPARVRF